MRTDYEVQDDVFNQLHGEGDIADDTITTEKYENMALSQEDVHILHQKELSILKELSVIMEETDLDELLKQHGSNIEDVRESDTKHPVDIFNILKRTSVMWRSIQQNAKDTRISNILGRENLDLIV